MSGIFINYRRADSASYAGRLFDALSDHYFITSQRLEVAGLPRQEAVALLTESVRNLMSRTA